MSPTATALTYLAAWWILVIVGLAAYRTTLTMVGTKQANEFEPEGRDLPPMGQRLTRVHANNYENLPMYGAILVFALASGQTSVTDGLASWLVLARVAQSVVHLASTAVPAVMVRFTLYGAQLAIVAVWLGRFLG